MKLATPDMIPKIDKYAEDVLGIQLTDLMLRSAEAVKQVIYEKRPKARKVLILAGKGNNGGDGYALAALLPKGCAVVCAVLSAKQRTEEGLYWMKKACEKADFAETLEQLPDFSIDRFDVIVDAVFGTGFIGEPPEELRHLVEKVNASPAFKVAIDVPLGVNALDGSVCKLNIPADATVTLSYPKPGLFSYPAKAIVGELIHSDLGLPREIIEREFKFLYRLVDFDTARELLPVRNKNTNKGSFGKTALIVGSDKYPGAAHLSLEAALRGGAGMTHFIGTPSLCAELRAKFPEAIFHSPSESDFLTSAVNSVLVGCGSSVSEELFRLVENLIENTEAQLVLDADALNSVAKYSSPEVFIKAKHPPIITPHPLELSRLSGASVSEIEANRLSFAVSFAQKYNCVLLLKGAATVITDGSAVYINSASTPALAKGGSGDTLAGLIASLTAFAPSPLEAAALAAYVHGRAGEELAESLSTFGVTPSDLPRKMAEILASIEKSK